MRERLRQRPIGRGRNLKKFVAPLTYAMVALVGFSRTYKDSSSAELDYSAFRAINGLAGKYPALDVIMIGSAKYLAVVFAVALIVLWLSWRSKNQRAAFLAGVSALVALGIGQIIGKLIPRPRPYLSHTITQLIPRSLDTSFPSDHATLGFAVATMIWFFNRKAGGLLLIVATLMAVSRVFVGAHYPGDIIGGAVLGSLTSVTLAGLAQRRFVRNLLDRTFSRLARWRLATRGAD